MSLFERISNKITEEKKNQRDNSYLFDDDKEQTKNNKKSKKQKQKIESGTYNYNQRKKQDQNISQKRSRETLRQNIINRQYDMDSGYGDSGGSEDGLRKGSSQTSQKTPPKNRAPRKGVDYFFDAEKAKKERDAFQQGRKAYTDSKSGIKAGKVTDKGVIDYITKARNMKQGTNANTKANREAAKVIAKSSGSEYKEKIRQKYETDKDLSRRRAKNQPSYAEIKKDIDARNPVKPGITGKPIPAKFIKTNVSDKEIQDAIKKAQKVKPTKTKKITVGSLEARDKAMKELDKVKIGTPSPEDIEKTEKLIKKQYKKQARTKFKPSEKEIEQSQKILDNQPKSKKFDGKSFDDFIKDSKKKNKQLEKEIKSLRTKSFVPPTRTAPNTNPFKFERIKNINRTRPIKTGTFRTTKAPKFSKTRTASKLAQYALGAYVVSQAFGGRGPGILPAGDRRPEIVSGKGGNIDFTLAGKPPEK